MISIAAVSLGGGASPTIAAGPSTAITPPLHHPLRIDCKSSLENGDNRTINSSLHPSWITFAGNTGETNEEHGLVPLSNPFQPLSPEVAMGLVLHAARGGGWTTDSGLEGPAFSSRNLSDELPDSNQWPELSKSPRRRMRIAFTCNVCGERTMRAINPHAYTDGTVFVQCKGCEVFHKLVDNLNLFYEWDGRLYKTTKKSLLPTDDEYIRILLREEVQIEDDN